MEKKKLQDKMVRGNWYVTREQMRWVKKSAKGETTESEIIRSLVQEKINNE